MKIRVANGLASILGEFSLRGQTNLILSQNLIKLNVGMGNTAYRRWFHPVISIDVNVTAVEANEVIHRFSVTHRPDSVSWGETHRAEYSGMPLAINVIHQAFPLRDVCYLHCPQHRVIMEKGRFLRGGKA